MYTTDFKQVGANIKRELEGLGMTQQKLADALGVSADTLLTAGGEPAPALPISRELRKTARKRCSWC
jgi:transcriptional regulator with XRE-family HTH domain